LRFKKISKRKKEEREKIRDLGGLVAGEKGGASEGENELQSPRGWRV